jgi:hypothetical protein
MAFNVKDFLTSLIDLGSEDYEDRVKELIVFGGLIALALIVIWRRA